MESSLRETDNLTFVKLTGSKLLPMLLSNALMQLILVKESKTVKIYLKVSPENEVKAM